MESDGRTEIEIFECVCDSDKIYRLTFDGDTSRNYIVEYCKLCYDSDDKLFLINQEEIL